MNREIKFRGKELIHNKWIYGGLAEDKDGNFVILPKSNWQKGGCVDKNTIGQLSGFTDKNGREIYEGDICKYTGGAVEAYFECCYVYGADFEGFDFTSQRTNSKTLVNIEVVGNVYDNPELIEKP